jgi:hypothetical protein
MAKSEVSSLFSLGDQRKVHRRVNAQRPVRWPQARTGGADFRVSADATET